MGPRSFHKRISRRVLPIIVVLLGTVGVTDAVMAADPCRIMLVRKLTEATEKAGQHVPARRKHTKATLAAWEVWGKEYLAKHGKPFTPPKRNPDLHPRTPKQFVSELKFACDILPLPTYDIPLTGLLVPLEIPVPPSQLPIQTAELGPAPRVTTPAADTPVTDTATPFAPIFFAPTGGPIPSGPGTPTGGGTTPPGGGGGGTTPPGGGGDTPPGGGGTVPVVPEPSTFVLLGTGISAAWAMRRRRS